MLIKNLNDADSWVVYHEDVGATKGLTFNDTSAPTTASTFFNNTSPTSSVFTVGSGGRTNGSSDQMIAYVFSEVPGFSKFGKFVGNGSATDGAFVHTGFKVRYLMMKRITSGQTNRWFIFDADRAAVSGANPVSTQFFGELTTAESAPDQNHDSLSNGFKLYTTGNNLSGQEHIFLAFAESPFKTATGR